MQAVRESKRGKKMKRNVERTVNPLPSLSSYKLHICTSAWRFVLQLSSVFVENNCFNSVLAEKCIQMSMTLGQWRAATLKVDLKQNWTYRGKLQSKDTVTFQKWTQGDLWGNVSSIHHFLQKMWNQHSVPLSSKMHLQNFSFKTVKNVVWGTFCK